MVKYAGKDERLKWRALLGNTRWGTVKHHSLVLIKVIKEQHSCPIPWQDDKVTSQILFYKNTAKTANQLRNFWARCPGSGLNAEPIRQVATTAHDDPHANGPRAPVR